MAVKNECRPVWELKFFPDPTFDYPYGPEQEWDSSHESVVYYKML